MLVTHPALFYYDDSDGTSAPYFVHFQIFKICLVLKEKILVMHWKWQVSS